MQATERLLANPLGSLSEGGKWHEVSSLYSGWSARAKFDPDAPLRMEALLKRLLQEQQGPNNSSGNTTWVTIDMYNALLDAWCCAALFRTKTSEKSLGH